MQHRNDDHVAESRLRTSVHHIETGVCPVPPETIHTSHQAVLAELHLRYRLTKWWRERTGTHIKVFCRGMRAMTMKLLYCTVSGPEGKVKATQASISTALHWGLLRLADKRHTDSWRVRCRGIAPFYVCKVKEEDEKGKGRWGGKRYTNLKPRKKGK